MFGRTRAIIDNRLPSLLPPRHAELRQSRLYEPGCQLIRAGDASGATLDVVFTENLGLFRSIQVDLISMRPATDGALFNAVASTDGGSTYMATTYGYERSVIATGAETLSTDTVATAWPLSDAVGNLDTEGVSGTLFLFSPAVAGVPQIRGMWEGCRLGTTGVLGWINMGLIKLSADDINALRFSFSAGNITSGSYRLIGWR